MTRFSFSLFIAALLGLLPNFASAHSVWIEELPNGQLCVRFAQWGDDYEKSPGHLDSFAPVSAWTLDGEGKSTLFDVEKKKDQFFLGKADATKPAFAPASFAIRKLHDDKPARAPIFTAAGSRMARAQARPPRRWTSCRPASPAKRVSISAANHSAGWKCSFSIRPSRSKS